MSRRTLVAGALGLSGAAVLHTEPAAAVAAPAGQDWPQWRGAGRDGVWKETGLLEKFSPGQLARRWSVPVSNGYSGPTVAEGRVYLTDRVVEPAERERIHCFDWESGKTLWSHAYARDYKGLSYPDGPRAAVTVHDGRAYFLGAMGDFHCYDAVSGKVIWKRDLRADYQIRLLEWGITAAPLIVENLVILLVGGQPGACVVALDRRTGEERWKALEDRASYAAPILIRQAGRPVLVCWTGDRVVGLNPQSGQTYWAQPFPRRRWVIGISTPVVERDRLFVTSAIDGALMLRLPPDHLAVEKLWERRGPTDRETDALQSLISTPALVGDHVYGVDYLGELRCLKADTGDRVWEHANLMPRHQWATAHLVRNGDRWWIFNERGELILARLSPQGYQEISRAKLLEPTTGQLPQRGGVCWSHPAFAYRHIFARNDTELVCASLAK